MTQGTNTETNPKQDVFSELLQLRVQAYFKEKGISRYANREMYLKSVLALFLWVGSYILLFFLPANTALIFAGYVFHGLTHIFLAYNIGHDANHGAYFSNKKLNYLMTFSFDLVGINSYLWRLMHNVAHHSHVNIYGTDEAIDSNGVFRFSPDEPWRPIHRYQHIYAPFLYSLIVLQWVLVKDYRLWFQRKIGPLKNHIHPLREYVILFGGKLFYYTYILLIPILFLPVSWYWIVLGFVLFQLINGFITAAIFQTTHLIEGTYFPGTTDHKEEHFQLYRHLLETTSDYAWTNRLFNWFTGCLNVHCIHHMMPNICHVHYYDLTHILKQTAEETGLKYRDHSSIYSAFQSHLRLLRVLGQPPYATISSHPKSMDHNG